MKRTTLPLGVWIILWITSSGALAQQLHVSNDVYVSPSELHRVFFRPGDPALASLRAAGAVRRVEDYRSFVLAIVDERQAGGRNALLDLGLTIRDDQAVIGINGAPLDTADRAGLAARLATIPAALRGDELDAAKSPAASLWLIQFIGPIRDEWLDRLQATGATIVTPMATNAYVVSVDAASLAAFSSLELEPVVQWVGAYHPFFRLDPDLRTRDLASPAPVDVTIQVIRGDPGRELVAALAQFRAIRPPEEVLDYVDVRVTIPANAIPSLAAHPAVFAIENLPAVRRMDEVQGQIVAGNLNAGLSGPSAPGYLAWLAGKGFADGQFAFTVDVADDGIDRGSTSDVNDEFKVLGAGAGASRVVYAHNYTSDPLADSGNGHGNINASIVGGYNALTGSAFEDAGAYNYGLGICPFVQLGGTKVFNNAGAGEFLATNLTRFTAAWSGGARFSTNSWGYITGNGYNADSQSHDVLVRDSSSAAGIQEMTIIFSAGNSGSAANTVHPPGTAKNVITVGASENNRQTGLDGCGSGNSSANNAMDMVGFSSRGPTSDGRKKPDIVAPGTHIQGAASRSLTYDGGGVCNQYWPNGQTLYCWSSGTSHSTPAVAGAAALVRQYFANQGWPTPSPAMVKGYLMDSARYMTGVGANDTLWSNSQGMGLADLGRAFDSASRIMVDQTTILSTSGQTYVATGTIASSLSPFRVALVWTDPAGPTTGNAWVNNLDLSVVVNGLTYLGNTFSGAGSVIGGVADAKNNAEFVFLPAGVTGTFTVTVTATNIAGDGVPGNGDITDQDFALLVYNGTTCATAAITTQPANQTACTASPASFSVVATGSGLTYQWRKNGANIPGATSSTYAIPSVVVADAGTYDVVVTSGCSVTSNSASLTVNSGPAITLQPTGGLVCQGTPKQFTVTATGTAPLSYQWRKDTVNIPGATLSTYLISMVAPGNAGTYDVVVTNSCGSTTSTGAAITVTPAASISTQPSPQGACSGMPASFSVVASGGPPLSYQWRKNLVNIPGATSSTYMIASTVAGDAGNYSVVVSNSCSSAISSNAALTVSTSVGITVQPSNAVACQGNLAGFSVGASGTAPLSYQWKKNGTNIPGATSASYLIFSTAPADAGNYSVTVSNACSSATSNAATLTVNTPPGITGQPSSSSACQGTPASFSVTASGTAPLSYQWKKNGANIGGATATTFAIASTALADAASYSVVVTNSCGMATSDAADLVVTVPPSVTANPAGQTVCEGAAASFSVTATGTAPLTYQWRKNGANIGGATSPTHAIGATSAADAGAYDVVVTNGCGSQTSSAAALTIDAPAAIATSPVAATVCAGAPAGFSATASGTAPITYQWRKDGVGIPGATSPSYAIAAAASGDAGAYDVVVTNGCGSATSSAAVLTVDDPPAITTGPAAQTVCEGAPAAFSVVATGTAPITYQWRKDGVDIPGATAASYAIAAAAPGDAGSYDVVVTDACSSVTSAGAALSLDSQVVVTTDPASAAACEGAPVSLSVAASGSGAITYQWRKDTVDIPGATTASYAIAAVAASDAGTYDVVVTNACNSVTSAGAVLTIDSPVAITTQPASQAACETAPAGFTVVATGTAPITYQWRKDGMPLSGATAASYAIPSALAADAGSYDVVVTNGCGSVTSDPATLTIDAPIAIVSQPSGQAVCGGDPVSLSVSVTGTPPIGYQWRKDGTGIAGATSFSFAIASASASDAGLYDVVVTDACSSVTSNGAPVTVGSPFLAALAPPSIAPLVPSSSAVTIAVSGSCFTPASVVYANGVALGTSFVDAANLSCLLPPSVPQTQILGGICFNVLTGSQVSNSAALVVGGGANSGTMRRHPLAPAPGDTYAIVLEGGVPFSPFSLFADLGAVIPVPAFPDPLSNFVLAVTPITGSPGPFLTIFDGLGVFSPPDGTAYDANGTFVIPGIVLPNPPIGIAATLQAAYLDPTSPIGLRLTWAKFPEAL